jgi:glutathione S-transferase
VKIYYHPVSTTSRPLMLFASESGIDVEFQVVDLLTGEHMKPGYASINPSHLVPVLEDGDFRLTESSAILKYLAEKTDSPAYPKDLRQRAKVNEMMDWFNTQICRDFAYGLVYPQIFPGQHRRPSDEQQQGTLAWAKERTKGWLKVLDQDLIGPNKQYLCGDQLTLADYFGAPFIALGEALRWDYAAYPNVKRWLDNMKSLKSWEKVHEVFYSYAGSMKDVQFEVV